MNAHAPVRLARMTELQRVADAGDTRDQAGQGVGWNLLDIVPYSIGFLALGSTSNRGYDASSRYLLAAALVLGLALGVAAVRKVRGVPQRLPYPFSLLHD
jgi:hypothetical protein